MGLGYIGLPTASILANRGFDVIGVDLNKHVVDTIKSGKIHIKEPDLDILVRSAVNSGKLRAELVPEPADVFIITAPTPLKHDSGQSHEPDMSCVHAATQAIIPHLKPGDLIILESTSPVGTTERIYQAIIAKRPELADRVLAAHCPERVLPGQILKELVTNDRIIGGMTAEAAKSAADLYRSFCKGKILLTNSRTAELAKLVENSFRDVNIAFANELSMICDTLDVNVWEVIELANRHPRVKILNPGPGVGGHCIAVDPWFIVAASPEQAKLIKTAREVNDAKPQWVIQKVRAAAESIQNPIIGCLGLTFKANVDDIRESPALAIARELYKQPEWKLMACDPYVNNGFKDFPLYPLEQVLKDADILLLLVDHEEFKAIIPDQLNDKIIIDTRNIWSQKQG